LLTILLPASSKNIVVGDLTQKNITKSMVCILNLAKK